MSYPVFQPYLGVEELAACSAALESKYLGLGSFVRDFEVALADFLSLGESHHILTFSTGHAAMHLGLLALGLKPGDEVITPSFNNIADFQAIEAVGATPVMCDIDENSLCIDPERAAQLITNKTKVIVAMDYASRIADHSKLASLASSYNVTLFHDAAHSFGSFYQNKPIGHQSEMTMMSFDPIKNITCIDGGALIFRNDILVEPLRQMRMIGMGQRIQKSYKNKRDWGYDVKLLGYRYHLSNLHASVGLSQLNKFAFIRSQRKLLYSAYYSKLDSLDVCITQGPLHDDVVPFIFCLRVPASKRNTFKAFLLDHGIETGIHWKPGHHFSRYRDCRRGPLPITDKIADEIVSLPFYPDMNVEDVDFISDKIISFFSSQ